MKALEDKIQELEGRLDKKKAEDEISDFERAKRDVKEEAAKAKVDIDSLHEKLILLDSLARKQNHDLKDKISLILSRFHIHKNKPSFAAALVLKLVCNKEEEAVLDKEQKLLKTFGFHDKQENQHMYNNVPAMGYGMIGTQMHNAPYMPRFTNPGRRFRPWFQASQAPMLCFRCNKPGHLVRDCPLNHNPPPPLLNFHYISG